MVSRLAESFTAFGRLNAVQAKPVRSANRDGRRLVSRQCFLCDGRALVAGQKPSSMSSGTG